MICKQLADTMIKELQQLTAGGGVTAPDDMIDLDDAIGIVRSWVSDNAKVDAHATICAMLNQIYEEKNHDYGDSFGIGFGKYGPIMALIRLEDKLNRLTSLITKGGQRVNDESITDTLMDLANYAIMTVIEMGAHDACNVSETNQKP